jgi:hypothetical protein
MVKRLGELPLPFCPHFAQHYWNLEIKHRLLLSLKPKLEICVSKHQLLSDIMCIQFGEEFHLCGHRGKVNLRRKCNSQHPCDPSPILIRIHWDSFCPTCCLRGKSPKAAESVCWNKLWRALNSTPEDFRGAGKGARAFEIIFLVHLQRILVQQARELIMHKFIIALTLPATVFKQEISSEFPRFPCAIAKDDIALCQIFRLESRMDLLETVDPSSLEQSQLNCKLCESSLDTHSPVRMPCCRRIVGRECIKKDVLGQNSSTDDCPICLFCLSPLLVVTPLEEFTLCWNHRCCATNNSTKQYSS